MEKKNNNPYITGLITGSLGTVIGCPMQYLKTNMQITNNNKQTKSMKTLSDLIKFTYKKSKK